MELKHEISVASLLKLSSFLFWSGLYVWCAIRSPVYNAEWCSRAITLLHGSVATIVGLFQCGLTTLTACRLTTKVTISHYALMLWSWGYFAFDLLWCLLYWTENTLMLCHHFSALAAITIYLKKDYTGCTFACTLAMMEVTNPLLQIRWFLRNEGYHKTIFYTAVEVTYLVMFLMVRGVFGSYLIYAILQSDIFDMDEKLISLVLYVVSLGLIYDVLGFVLYKYKSKIARFTGFESDEDLEELRDLSQEH